MSHDAGGLVITEILCKKSLKKAEADEKKPTKLHRFQLLDKQKLTKKA